MKKRVIISAAVLSLFVISSCGEEKLPENPHLLNSYELTVQGDTINRVYNNLKQGKWVEKHDGKNDTVYYKNDTLVK